MKKIIATLLTITLLAGLLIGSLTGCRNRGLAEFNLGYLASTGHILKFIAYERGYFEQNGLDVQMHLFSNSGEGINAIVAGQLDAGAFGTAPPFTFIEQGVNINIFGGMMTEGHAFIARPENAESFRDLDNLRGRTIATVRLATGDIVLRSALAEAGIDWERDLTINEFGAPSEVLLAVREGRVDAGVVWTPFREMAQDQGMEVVYYSGQFPGASNHPCCRMLATGENLTENAETFEAFMTALIMAYDFYRTNTEESLDILALFVPQPRDILYAETFGPHISSNPDPEKGAVVNFWEAMVTAGYIEGNADIAAHINTQIFASALAGLLEQYPDNENFLSLQANFVP